MTCTLHVAWDHRLTGYDFGPEHPLAPVRVELTIELARAFGLLTAAGVSVAAPEPGVERDRVDRPEHHDALVRPSFEHGFETGGESEDALAGARDQWLLVPR